jgi:uncharacterized membrane protein YdjX (TVP38/TMEM64 family)
MPPGARPRPPSPAARRALSLPSGGERHAPDAGQPPAGAAARGRRAGWAGDPRVLGRGGGAVTLHRLLTLSPTALAHSISRYGSVPALVASLFVMALQTFLPFIPFFVITGANVLIFGFWRGAALTYVGAFLGDSLAFWVTRRFGRAFVVRWLPERAMDHWVRYFQRRRGAWLVVFSRTMPVIPAGLVNLAAGLADMPYPPFAIATLIGNLPAAILNSLLGHDLFTFSQNKWHLAEVVGVFVVLSLLGELWLRLNPVEEDRPASRPFARRNGPRVPRP